jgi:serine/threonine protein phosphatase PrpC
MDIYVQANSNITHDNDDNFLASLWYSRNSDLIVDTNGFGSGTGDFAQRYATQVSSSQIKAHNEKFYKYNNYHVSQSIGLDLAPGAMLYPRLKTTGTNNFVVNVYWIINYTKIPL